MAVKSIWSRHRKCKTDETQRGNEPNGNKYGDLCMLGTTCQQKDMIFCTLHLNSFYPFRIFVFFFSIFNVTWDFLDRSIRQDMFVHCVGSPVRISKMNDPFIYFFYFLFLKNDIYLFRGAVLIKCANIKHPTSLRFQLNICLVTTDIRHWEMRVERYSYLLFFLEKRWH